MAIECFRHNKKNKPTAKSIFLTMHAIEITLKEGDRTNDSAFTTNRRIAIKTK